MNAEITVALITGIFTFAGVVLTVVTGNKKTARQIKEQSDLTIYRIEQLEKKQDRYNNLQDRMYHTEEEVRVLGEKMKTANHRIDDLEKKAG